MAKPTMAKLEMAKIINDFFMAKLEMVELTMSKINVAKLTNE
jgi:hypothetical protein